MSSLIPAHVITPEVMEELLKEDPTPLTSISLQIDASSTSASTLGSVFPHLTQLDLSNSILPSLRDLGTGLKSLTVLRVVRVGLTSLDGVTALPALTELYMAFNAVQDLSPLPLLEHLALLDLEANPVDSLDSLEYLLMLPSLSSLSLEGTPLYASYPSLSKARTAVRSTLPNLAFIDDIPAHDVHHVDTHAPPGEAAMVSAALQASSVSAHDLHATMASVFGISLDDDERSLLDAIMTTKHSEAERILQPAAARPSTSAGIRPRGASAELEALRMRATQSPIGSGSGGGGGSESTMIAASASDASSLTVGTTVAMAGNPLHALRKRRAAGVVEQEPQVGSTSQNNPYPARPSTSAGIRSVAIKTEHTAVSFDALMNGSSSRPRGQGKADVLTLTPRPPSQPPSQPPSSKSSAVAAAAASASGAGAGAGGTAGAGAAAGGRPRPKRRLLRGSRSTSGSRGSSSKPLSQSDLVIAQSQAAERLKASSSIPVLIPTRSSSAATATATATATASTVVGAGGREQRRVVVLSGNPSSSRSEVVSSPVRAPPSRRSRERRT